jgi:hypothetical protein
LYHRVQIPFWIVATTVVLLPCIYTLLIVNYTIIYPFTVMLLVDFIFGSILTAFYVIVAIKAVKIISRSKRLHSQNKSRISALKKNRVTIILAGITSSLCTLIAFLTRYLVVCGYPVDYIFVLPLIDETVLLGVLCFLQTWFLPNKN